jgi:exopolyphosphatase/guanosine-5'-triphosphate,3'-diphosphate pyrophosphatase
LITSDADVSTEGPTVGAAIDAGSNSVHLVVGSIDPSGVGVTPIVDESELLGLGDAVDATGEIDRDGEQRLIAAVRRYLAVARAYGASHVTLLGTEPFRRATNGATVAHAVEDATGLRLHVLRHEDEGLLTLFGVTGGAPVHERMLVVDIGGGSSEFVLASPDGRSVAGAVATGASRLTKQAVRHDPPTADEIAGLRESATRLVDVAGGSSSGAPRADRAVLVGGTATNLVKLSPVASAEMRLERSALPELYDVIGTMPADAIAERYLVNRRRAGMLAAGAALVEAFLDRFEVAVADVSRVSLREGAILVRERSGEAWLERLADGGLRAS